MIRELTNKEVDDISGGNMEWRLSWSCGKFLVAACMLYNYENLSTYDVGIKALKSSDSWQSSSINIASGLLKDGFMFASSFFGLKTIYNSVIPFVFIKAVKLVKRK